MVSRARKKTAAARRQKAGRPSPPASAGGRLSGWRAQEARVRRRADALIRLLSTTRRGSGGRHVVADAFAACSSALAGCGLVTPSAFKRLGGPRLVADGLVRSRDVTLSLSEGGRTRRVTLVRVTLTRAGRSVARFEAARREREANLAAERGREEHARMIDRELLARYGRHASSAERAAVEREVAEAMGRPW